MREVHFVSFALAGVEYSGFMTWLYAKTTSILLCVLFHASINASAAMGIVVAMNHTKGHLYCSIFAFMAVILLRLYAQVKNTDFETGC